MANLNKMKKDFTKLDEEQKKDYLEFLNLEDEETKVEVKEEPKVEVKVDDKAEPKVEVKEEPKVETNFEELYKKLTSEFDDKLKTVVKEIKEVKDKSTNAFGVKAQPKETKDSNEFEDLFAKLTKNQ